jgi:hypothetical protein
MVAEDTIEKLMDLLPGGRTPALSVTAVARPAAVVLASGQNATTAAVDLGTSEALANALKANYNQLQADVVALQAQNAALIAILVTAGMLT